jgi:hypothetical protein
LSAGGWCDGRFLLIGPESIGPFLHPGTRPEAAERFAGHLRLAD